MASLKRTTKFNAMSVAQWHVFVLIISTVKRPGPIQEVHTQSQLKTDIIYEQPRGAHIYETNTHKIMIHSFSDTGGQTL